MIKTLITLISFVLVFLQAYAQPFVEQTETGLPNLSSSSAQWGDYDNDGDLDILIAGELSRGNCIAKIFRNNGNGTFEEQVILNNPNGVTGKVAWGDYDNDGLLDALVPGRNSETNSAVSLVYKNNGDNTFSKNDNDSLTGTSNPGSAYFVDYDNDGDLDVSLSANFHHFYTNDNGILKESTDKIIDQTSGDLHTSAWGDFNNNGMIDLITAGKGQVNLYFNNNFSFTNANSSIMDANHGELAWADYDSDGDLDVLITGSTRTGYKTKLHRNNGNGTFSVLNASFTGVQLSSIAWGDYDNDGDLDLCYNGSGSTSTMFYKNNNGSFSQLSSLGLSGANSGTVVCADFDNDGDLDLLITGRGLTKIYRNDCPTANTAPASPTVLSASTSESITTFTWEASTDDYTPAPALTYNLRVGTTPGGCEIVSPMADASGYRRIVGMGNAQLGNNYLLKNLKPGTYYWSVQAIDNGYAGGAFAEEQSFTVSGTSNVINGQLNAPAVFPNPATSHINIECNCLIKAKIFNQSGACVVESTNTQIDISHLPAGLYIVNIETALGTTQIKLIKQ